MTNDGNYTILIDDRLVMMVMMTTTAKQELCTWDSSYTRRSWSNSYHYRTIKEFSNTDRTRDIRIPKGECLVER